MSQRFYDHTSGIYIPSDLEKMIKIKKTVATNYEYKNLDEFCLGVKNYFLQSGMNFYIEPNITLQTKKGWVDFELEADYLSLPYQIKFMVRRKKETFKKCLVFAWYPFNKTIYIHNLLYDSVSKKKIDAKLECDIDNIPKKAGEFFLNMVEDIGRKLGVKQIILQDASQIFLDDGKKISLAMYYLFKNGTTYYEKYGYEPVKTKEYNAVLDNDIMFNIPFVSDKDTLKYIKKEIKKCPDPDRDLPDWIRCSVPVKMYFPEMYRKKLP